MRILPGLLVIAACSSSSQHVRPRPEVIEVVRPLADQACDFGTDKECLRAVRVQFDTGACAAAAMLAVSRCGSRRGSDHGRHVGPCAYDHVVIACCCPRDRMCDRCVADSFAQLRGVAACRGEVWAMSVAERCGRRQAWPASDRATAIAQRKVADLTSDARLAELLVRELTRWAARWWDAPQHPA